jgi:hypothetical protein
MVAAAMSSGVSASSQLCSRDCWLRVDVRNRSAVATRRIPDALALFDRRVGRH